MLFVLPVVLGTVVFNLFPIVVSLFASFTDWHALGSPHWVGLQNYAEIFTIDPWFSESLTNTLYFSAGSIPLGMAVSLAFALLVNREMRGISFFRACYYVPVLSSVVAVALVWQWLLNPQLGLVNGALRGLFGIDGPGWMFDPAWAMPSVIIASVWSGLGYNMMLYLAGLKGIPIELYEAAKIDGAGAWQRFRHVTFPLLSPTTFFIAVMATIGSFQVFGLIYAMTDGGPGTATMVYVYYLWQKAFSAFQLGYASALAWLLFLVIGGLTFFQWKMSDRWVFYR